MQVRIFLDSAETIYCFPIALNPNFRFFLKSMNLKELEISPNSHFTGVLRKLRPLKLGPKTRLSFLDYENY